jgi:hypothetical protein
VVFSRTVSPGRRNEDDADTPPTRSYVDALLNQSLSSHQLAHLRAEIVKHDGELPEEDEEDGQRTRFHSYSEAERQSSRPAARQTPAPPADDDEDGQRTRFHSYSEAERRSAAPAPIDDDDDESGQRTRFHSYSEAERRSAAPPPDEDDDARTLYRPASRQPPKMPSNAPRASAPPPRSVPPVSSDRYPPRSAPPVSSDRAPPPRSSQPSSSERIPVLSQSSQRIPVLSQSSPRIPHLASSDRLPLVELEPPPSARPPMPTIDLDVPISVPTPPPYEQEAVPLSAPTPGKLDTRAIDKTYLDAVGGPNGIPRLAVSPAKLTSLALQPQAGFLISMIDGQSSVDDLIDISGLSRLETLRMLYHLLQQGVISVGKR